MANPRPPPTKYQAPNRAYFLPVESAETPEKAPDGKKKPKSLAPAEKRRARMRTLGTTAAALLLVLVVIVVAAALVLPGFIKRQCIALAASRGVTLTIDDVRLGPHEFTLVRVGATVDEVPGVKATAAEVAVDGNWIFEPRAITVRSPELVADAPFEATRAAFAKWSRAKNGAAAPFPHITVDDARVTWNHAFGEGRIECVGLHAEMIDRGGSDEVHVMAPRVSIVSGSTMLGPWRADYDRTSGSARLRVAFDPQVPDGANALVVSNDERVTAFDLNVPRARLTQLGIDPRVLGFAPSDGTQIEARVQFDHAMPDKVQARATMGLYGIRFESAPAAFEATLDAYGAGDPKTPIDVKKGTMTFGPLKGNLVGTLKLVDEGFRLELGWKGGPLPCSAFFTPPPSRPDAPPDPVVELQRELGEFAQNTGIARVTGDISAEARLVLDSRDLGQTQVSFTPSASCNVSLFGR